MKKDELVKHFFDVLATDDLDEITDFMNVHPEIESVLVERMQAAGFEPDTKNGWERLIDDGVWMNKGYHKTFPHK